MDIHLTQSLHRAVQHSANNVACRFGQRCTTYAELKNRVARLATVLCNLGIKPADRVGMLSQNSDRYLECYLAVWWAGAVINPINTRWTAAEVAFSLRDCDTRILIVDGIFAAMVPELRRLVPGLRDVVCIIDDEDLSPLQDDPAAHLYDALIGSAKPMDDQCAAGNTLAAIFYTGGTTGRPKGVMLSHANLWTSGLARMAQIHSPQGSTTLHVTPFYHLASAGRLITQIVMAGESVIMRSFVPDEFIACIEQHRVHEVTLVPSMIRMLLDTPALNPRRLSSLRRISYGGSPISASILERALKILPWVEFSQSYGQTEAAPIITINPPESHAAQDRDRLRSAGRACYSVELQIRDVQERELPRGEIGEICARGPNVMLGYWNRPEETSHALRGGWLHTGDVGYMDEVGYIFIVDRLKDMIVSGGENVYAAEVEEAIRQHAAVSDCAVFGIPSERWGESVHAAIVLKPGTQMALNELQEHCRALIAGYKVPRSMEVLTELPLSSVGKILKTALRQPYWSGCSRRVS